MGSETKSESTTVTDGRASRIVNRIWFGYNALSLIATFGAYIFTLVIAVPVLKTCFMVGLFVMIIGAVLGLIQLVPEFLRKFIKLEVRPARIVNYFFYIILAVRFVWLIAATVIVTESECNNISYAWISIYVNWGIFSFTAAVILIIVVVGCLKARHQTRL